MRGDLFEYAQPTNIQPLMFQLSGASTTELAEKLINTIKTSLQTNNFETILSPSRDFSMYVWPPLIFTIYILTCL